MEHTRIPSPNMEHLSFHIRASATSLTSPTTTTNNNPYSMEKPLSKGSDHRRSNKPIMEKRRRARINHCLGELKGLILEAMKKDPARHSKLEKADILEMTVKHLQNMQRQQMAVAVATDPTVMTKFRAGFNECATEVARYVSRIEGVEPGIRQRLLVHLRSCLTGLNYLTPGTFACMLPEGGQLGQATFMPPGLQPVHVQVSPPTSSAPTAGVRPQAPFNSNSSGPGESRMFSGLHLIPSRLPNGDIAFVLPQQRQQPSATLSPPSQESEDETRHSTTNSPPNRTGSPMTPAPTFPSNPLITTTCDNRRTPSAFTSVPNGTTNTNSSLLHVNPTDSNTTYPRMSSMFGSTLHSNSGNKNIPLLCIKREDPQVKPSSSSSDYKETIPSVPQVPAKIPSPPSSSSSEESLSKCKSQTTQNRNQSEAYDLSRPSTSNVCSMTDNDKMWRPW